MVQFPMDDGTCSTFTNSKDCQHYSATVDRSVKMCSWSDGLDGEEGKCVYSDPSFHLKVSICYTYIEANVVFDYCDADDDCSVRSGCDIGGSNKSGGGLYLRGHPLCPHSESRKDARNALAATNHAADHIGPSCTQSFQCCQEGLRRHGASSDSRSKQLTFCGANGI